MYTAVPRYCTAVPTYLNLGAIRFTFVHDRTKFRSKFSRTKYSNIYRRKVYIVNAVLSTLRKCKLA